MHMTPSPASCRRTKADGSGQHQEELPVLEAFIYIRIRLTALKKVSSTVSNSIHQPLGQAATQHRVLVRMRRFAF